MEEQMNSEKIITEYRVVETEDGFRIEIKGDKEAIRKMGFIPGIEGFRGGPRGKHRGHGGHHKHGHGGHGRGFKHGMRRRMKHMMMMKMAKKMKERGGFGEAAPDWWFGPEEGAPNSDAPRRGPEADRPSGQNPQYV